MSSFFKQKEDKITYTKETRDCYDNLIIDAQNLFWRSNLTSIEINGHTLNSKLVNRETIRVFLKNLKFLMSTYGRTDSKIYLLFDNALSKINFRKQLDPEYKHSREKNGVPVGTYETLDLIKELLKHSSDNYFICYEPGLEADDLTLSIKNSLEGLQYSLFISSDLDWARNIDQFCHWYNFAKIYTIQTFKDKHGFFPDGNSLKLYKAIKGDASDNIKVAIYDLPIEIVTYIIIKYATLIDLYQNLENDQHLSKYKQKFIDNKERIVLNYRLVDFLIPDIELSKFCYQCKKDIKILNTYLQLLHLDDEIETSTTKHKAIF